MKNGVLVASKLKLYDCLLESLYLEVVFISFYPLYNQAGLWSLLPLEKRHLGQIASSIPQSYTCRLWLFWQIIFCYVSVCAKHSFTLTYAYNKTNYTWAYPMYNYALTYHRGDYEHNIYIYTPLNLKPHHYHLHHLYLQTRCHLPTMGKAKRPPTTTFSVSITEVLRCVVFQWEEWDTMVLPER